MRLIAIEEHILPLNVREAWASAPPPYDPVSAIADGGETGDRLADLGEGRLALMDEQGVDIQVLSLTTPGLHNLEPGPAVEAARRVNDLIAETCARHPSRFQGFAALPTSDPETAPRELERAVRDLGLKGARPTSRPSRPQAHVGQGGGAWRPSLYSSPDPVAGGP
jgi:predicted TIM-barrel fold metal-dependent hydrolase